MGVVTFPTNRTRAACYACFDFKSGDKQICPVCQRGTGDRMAECDRPQRPNMFATMGDQTRD